MRFRDTRVTMIWLPLILFFSVWSAHAKDDIPRITSTRFKTRPFSVQYFDDSDVVLAQEGRGVLWRSTDAGAKWSVVEDMDAGDDGRGPVQSVWMHPYDNNKAYALSPGNVHWITKDKGDSWQKFTIPGSHVMPSLFRLPLAFHAGNSKKVVFNGQKCRNPFECDELSYYTTDDFKAVEELRDDSRGCIWAHASPQSHSDRMKDDKDDDRILCIVMGEDGGQVWENRIIMSDDFFATNTEPRMAEGRTIKGIINITVVKGYIITAAKAPGSSELALFVTVDGERWHRAEFPGGHKIREEEYTIVESTNYSMQVDVMNTNVAAPMGVLFSSNSNGTYFTELIPHTNRNLERIVDFEKIQGIQGIILVNVVKNWKEVEALPKQRRKQIQSKISFDDGRSWSSLKVSSGKRATESLHLHSVTDLANVGRVFSSPAPGVVMGIGNTGDFLGPYNEGDLYVSDDAGRTWRRALASSHKYEFGDQGTVLLAIPDGGPTTKASYSLDHGDNWTDFEVDENQFAVDFLTTVPDSTTMKFLVDATKRDKDGVGYYLYSIDFTGIYKNKCKDGDFEDWNARLDEKEDPDCLMGRKQKYRRRQKDAKCYVGQKFKEAEPEFESCTCTWEDYECDFDFKPEGSGEDKKCNPATKLDLPQGACKEGDKTYKGPAGFRKIPGNQCHDGVEKDEEEVERPCDQSDLGSKPEGDLTVKATDFPGEGFGQKIYLERSEHASGDDETIIMSIINSQNRVSGMWKSDDHGKNWERLFEEDDNVQDIVQHPYENDRAFFLSPNSQTVHYTINRAKTTFHKFHAEAPLAEWKYGPLSFHPTEKEYILWTGRENCDYSDDSDCHRVVYVSKDRGDHWDTVVRYSDKCEFIKPQSRGGKADLLFCIQHKDEIPDGKLELRSSDDFFNSWEPKADDVVSFASMSEFVIVAQEDAESHLKVKASVWGGDLADALFPPNFQPPGTAFTVLDSSTHAVFMHVTESEVGGFEYGRIMKSNSNGTSYVLSVKAVNRNGLGYVDFEKMQGMDGVAMVNTVDNVEDQKSGKIKKLRSLITHNDGSEWAPLTAPDTKPDGSGWGCDVSKPEACSLHLHSYTERDDPRDTFSSPSAVGLMMGVGNVGEHLGDINKDVFTFLSKDAGITWKAVKEGRFMWEYGDQGSVIVIVERKQTNVGYYTTDEGETWKEFNFANEKAQVLDLTTLPSDTSRQFLIWVKYDEGKLGTINVDFSPIHSDRFCIINEENDHADDDYYLWSPKHPQQEDDCVFGRKVKFLRKKPGANCWNGPKLERQHGEITNCTCSKRDFEW